jgi:uncharacterized membrane protein
MYEKHFRNINNGDMNPDSLQKIILGAIISYLLLALGLYVLVIKQNNSILYGCLYGLVVYGVYNYTNLSTITKYDYEVAIKDTLWGTILCGLMVAIYNRMF